MHITDWKSTAWLRALGQKSSSIVSDDWFRPKSVGEGGDSGGLISKNLIGHFDPNNSDSYDDSNGGDVYENLVEGGEDLCLISMETTPAGESGAPDFEGPTTTSEGYMVGDGIDNHLHQCDGGYSDNFTLNAAGDFTLNIWGFTSSFPGSKGACVRQQGLIGVGAMNDYSNGGCSVGIMEDNDSQGMRIALFCGDPLQFSMPMFSARRSIGQKLEFNKWYMFSLVKETGNIIGEGESSYQDKDRITLYVNGVYQRLIPGSNCQAGTNHGGEMVPAGVIGGTQSIIAMAMAEEYEGFLGSVNYALNGGVGHILVYDRALKHSELRQNYLALNHIYYPWRQGGAIGPNHPNH